MVVVKRKLGVVRRRIARCGIGAVLGGLGTLLGSGGAWALFLDGEGHYSLLSELREAPGFAGRRGSYQAIRQNFRLLGELRLNDRISTFLEFRLFDDPRTPYLGDSAQPMTCSSREGGSVDEGEECRGRHQDTESPRYAPYIPKVTRVYARYAFDYCILEAGRRPRHWALGAFINAGTGPFDVDGSTYDGVNCDINIQKSNTLGVNFGWDRLAETGDRMFDPRERRVQDRNEIAGMEAESFGAMRTSDDLDQIFFTILFDDRRANAGGSFAKEIGLYYQRVMGSEEQKLPQSSGAATVSHRTEINYIDLYTAFYAGDLAFRNELIFRMGRSADPNWVQHGGRRDDLGQPVRHDLQALAAVGGLEYTLSRSGSVVGPVEYNEGTARRHLLTLDYAFVPGDGDGYYVDDSAQVAAGLGEERRDGKVRAMALHRNFRPSLLLLDGPAETRDMRVDGVYDPERLVNVSLFGLGYKYETMTYGSIAVKLLTAQLRDGIPGDVKEAYIAEEARPIGFAGKDLGWELDIRYSYLWGREVDLGVAAGVGLPGSAWQTDRGAAPKNSFLLQTFAAFKF